MGIRTKSRMIMRYINSIYGHSRFFAGYLPSTATRIFTDKLPTKRRRAATYYCYLRILAHDKHYSAFREASSDRENLIPAAHAFSRNLIFVFLRGVVDVR